MVRAEKMQVFRLIAGEVKDQIRVAEVSRVCSVAPERTRRKARKITRILAKRWASQARSC
jgi:hypothetical protein